MKIYLAAAPLAAEAAAEAALAADAALEAAAAAPLAAEAALEADAPLAAEAALEAACVAALAADLAAVAAIFAPRRATRFTVATCLRRAREVRLAVRFRVVRAIYIYIKQKNIIFQVAYNFSGGL
jgi:hypothetical protein